MASDESAVGDLVDVVARGFRRGEDVGGVVAALDLENGLQTGFANVEVDAFADVLDVDQVCSGSGEYRQQTGESTGAVADSREQDETPARLRLAKRYRTPSPPVSVLVFDAQEHPRRLVDITASKVPWGARWIGRCAPRRPALLNAPSRPPNS